MSDLLYKEVAKSSILINKGRGVWLYDNKGNKYIDSCSGVGVSSLGHNHPAVIQAMIAESQNITWVHAGSFTTEASEELARFLVSRSNGLFKAQFLSGGSEAVELALKTAYQYHVENGKSSKKIFIARKQSYHGSTINTLSISGNVHRRSIYENYFAPTEFVSPCYEYRDCLEGESTADYVARLVNEFEKKILDVGSDNVAGFIIEPVVGSTNGAVPACPLYLEKIHKICQKYDVLLILDEVMCGMGRTGHIFSYLEDKITPDIVVIGKGLAAGYQPLSAMLISKEIYESIENGSGILNNGQTHVNHPFACAIALCVQKTIEEENLITKSITNGELIRRAIKENFSECDVIGDVRGRGSFIGIELVDNIELKTPFDGGGDFVSNFKSCCLDNGLLAYPGKGTIDGKLGTHILIAPPFVSNEEELNFMIKTLSLSLTTCINKNK
mgnify:CR=1 FL=1|jgi:adenosylmethionine-8-amino-7-oxononanoate aminotransferase|tara:strand:- start:58 stop:1386 length:1329 start_codon:yes stop_codon:yes gene_type:complete